MHEHLRHPELAPELVRAYAQIFLPRWDRYPLQLPNSRKYVQVEAPLTLRLVIDHLTAFRMGRKPITLGAYALNEQSYAQWLCLDADETDLWQQLGTLVGFLRTQDIPYYQELSRRGGHVWLFLPRTTGRATRLFAKELLKSHSIPEKRGKTPGIEIYPKQDRLLDGAGSFVRLPLGLHQLSGQVYSFIDHQGRPLARTIREQIALLAQPQRVPMDFIRQTLAAMTEKLPKLSPSPHFQKRQPREGETLSETLKNTMSVFEFVAQFVPLDEHHKGLCPFHEDTEPSFQVNQERNYWHCYAGCGGGSIIDFWMKWREKAGQDSSFAATVKDLRQMLLK